MEDDISAQPLFPLVLCGENTSKFTAEKERTRRLRRGDLSNPTSAIRHQTSDFRFYVFFFTLGNHQCCYTVANDIGNGAGLTHKFIYTQ